MAEHTNEKDQKRRPESIAEQVIRDVEQHSSAAKNAVTGDLVGYFVPIDQWRALRSLLRTIPPAEETR